MTPTSQTALLSPLYFCVLLCVFLSFAWQGCAVSIPPREDDVNAVNVSLSTGVSPSEISGSLVAKLGGGHPKVGLVWSNGEDDHLHQYVTSKTYFIYTWGASCPTQASALHLNCARMLWGPASSKVTSFRKLRTSPGTNVLMGMNEVNEPSQANMKVQAGVNLWNAEIRPWGKQGYTLVSPAVTSGPSGITWLKGFFAKCGGTDKCGVNILAIHYYGTSIQAFKDHVTLYHNTFGLPIWVTEFACQDFVGGPQCNKAQVWNFMSQVTAWMNQQSFVQAYFAFGALHQMWGVNPLNQLMKGDGSPTDLGYFYINT